MLSPVLLDEICSQQTHDFAAELRSFGEWDFPIERFRELAMLRGQVRLFHLDFALAPWDEKPPVTRPNRAHIKPATSDLNRAKSHRIPFLPCKSTVSTCPPNGSANPSGIWRTLYTRRTR